jgi:hypothetical protein
MEHPDTNWKEKSCSRFWPKLRRRLRCSFVFKYFRKKEDGNNKFQTQVHHHSPEHSREVFFFCFSLLSVLCSVGSLLFYLRFDVYFLRLVIACFLLSFSCSLLIWSLLSIPLLCLKHTPSLMVFTRNFKCLFRQNCSKCTESKVNSLCCSVLRRGFASLSSEPLYCKLFMESSVVWKIDIDERRTEWDEETIQFWKHIQRKITKELWVQWEWSFFNNILLRNTSDLCNIFRQNIK